MLIVLFVLAVVSRHQGWELLGLPWWVWLVLAIPALVLAIDLLLARRGSGLVQTREAALVLLGLLAAGNFGALGILVAGLVCACAPAALVAVAGEVLGHVSTVPHEAEAQLSRGWGVTTRFERG